MAAALRNLIVILGDQLDRQSSVFDDFDPQRDAIWMAEVDGEATHVWSTQPRIVMFLAAMRHFRDELRQRDWTVHYREIGSHAHRSLEAALAEDLGRLQPKRVLAVKPGEYRLAQSLPEVCTRLGVTWTECADRHFYCDDEEFRVWAKGRKEYRLEFFYRWMRKRTGLLMQGDAPEGGAWNYDADNRAAFDRKGPGLIPPPLPFAPDPLTAEVIEVVQQRFAHHPGTLNAFDWPLTPAEAEHALQDFIRHRLPMFGRYQDAMWTDQPWLYHARISAALNLKLLAPQVAVEAALRAYREGHAPLAAVEGFVRQILGWREFIRGMYWLRMPDFLEDNALQAEAPLPDFYWTGKTRMHCLQQSIGQTLTLGYAHHIQRLMVTGLYAQLLDVRPQAVHEWYLAVYVDAVEWVELPNVMGMSQYADGGRMVSKPYVASGKYIERMSNYCGHCPYRPDRAVGEDACPFTTLYWDFLMRHEQRFARHPRTALQWKNLARLDDSQRQAIRERAAQIRTNGGEPVHGIATADLA